MKNIDVKVRQQIVKRLISSSGFLGHYIEYDGIITFLEKIWDLKNLPSEDSRFKNAQEDAFQHLINNDDWDLEYVFLERFSVVESDFDVFRKFLEIVVHPTVRIDKEEIVSFVTLINTLLEKTEYRLILSSYFEELPVFKLKLDAIDLPIDIIANEIPIYLDSYRNKKQYPCFILKYDNWDDYGFKTQFDLRYYQSLIKFRDVGQVKIMRTGAIRTFDSLDDSFTQLSNDYCSLGVREQYYNNLKDLLGDRFFSFLFAIRDVAIFPKIYDQFENDEIFKTSLVRFNATERLARTIRYEIEGISSDDYYKFNYFHTPPYAENNIVLNFDFEYNTDFEHRVFALIGKNGTGKTRLLSALAKSLSQKNNTDFSPRKPVYGKVFTVSYSYFDRFEIPNSNASFNYVYCGLKNGQDSFKTEVQLLEQFYSSATKIKERDLDLEWLKILNKFVSTEITEGGKLPQK